mgnify:CR=1 FL=1
MANWVKKLKENVHKELHKKKWIAGAIEHPGALTKKANAAGKTVAEFESSYKGSNTKTKKQIALAETLKSFHHKG